MSRLKLVTWGRQGFLSGLIKELSALGRIGSAATSRDLYTVIAHQEKTHQQPQ